jgi:peroxiredoxin Q/BCP
MIGIDDRAPDFELLNQDGDTVKLSEYGLPFTLLSDAEHKVAEAYGVWAEKSMYGRKYWGNLRTTFVIDGDGKIAHVFPKVSPKTHDDVVLEALAA